MPRPEDGSTLILEMPEYAIKKFIIRSKNSYTLQKETNKKYGIKKRSRSLASLLNDID